MYNKIKILSSIIMLVAMLPAAYGEAPGEAGDTFIHLFRSLQVKDEPSLKDQCEGGYAALRFFEYDSSGPRGLIRVEQLDEQIRYTRRVFAAEYGPGVSTRLIDADDWQELVDKFTAGGFWEVTQDPTLWVPDTTTWLFESCIAETYHSMQAYPERDLRMRDTVTALGALSL